MKKNERKKLKVFVFGGLFSIPIFFLATLFDGTFLGFLVTIFIAPIFVLISKTGTLADWICAFFEWDMCRGLGFDGGPLEFLEWIWLFLYVFLWSGLIFLVSYLIYKKVRACLKA